MREPNRGRYEGQPWVNVKSRLRITAERKRHRYSQRQLAAQVNQIRRCSHTTIGLLESGGMTTCTPELADAIEQVLGVEPGTLFVPVADDAVPGVASGKRAKSRERVA